MNLDLKAIRAAAEAATPGPWWHGELNPADGHALAWLGQSFVDCAGGHRNYVDPALDAAYIATTNPATVIALLDRLEAAEKDAADWRRRYEIERGAVEQTIVGGRYPDGSAAW